MATQAPLTLVHKIAILCCALVVVVVVVVVFETQRPAIGGLHMELLGGLDVLPFAFALAVGDAAAAFLPALPLDPPARLVVTGTTKYRFMIRVLDAFEDCFLQCGHVAPPHPLGSSLADLLLIPQDDFPLQFLLARQDQSRYVFAWDMV